MNPSSPTSRGAFRLGDWLAEPALNRLSRNGQNVTVENKTMDVLVAMAAAPGTVLSADELVATVWDNRPMGDNPVYKCVTNLRKVLGDDPKAPRYIETISRKGYRLIAGVTPVNEQTRESETAQTSRIKAISLTVAGLMLAASILAWILPEPQDPAGDKQVLVNSIAVLPFENLGGNTDDDILANGISEELLNSLASVSNLRVVTRNSSFAINDREQGLTEITETLHVNYILTGSIRRSSDQVRLTARLVQADGAVIWTESFNRTLDDLFTIQDDISRTVMEGLAIANPDSFKKENEQPVAYAAYSSYLLGNEYLQRRSAGWRARATSAFEDAIRIEPDYAPPYAGLAATILTGYDANEEERLEAKLVLGTALRLDPNLAQAHAAAGLYAMGSGDLTGYQEAVTHFERALQLNSSLVGTRNWLSICYKVLGERKASIRLLEEALEIDPLNYTLAANLGRKYQSDGELERAKAQFRQSLDLPDAQPYLWTWIAEAEEESGNLDTALNHLKKGVRENTFDDPDFWYAGFIATYYARLGMFDSANTWLDYVGLPYDSSWRILHDYKVLVPQGQIQELGKKVEQHQQSLGSESGLTLMSRSLIGNSLVLQGEYEQAIATLQPIFDEGWILQNAPGGSVAMLDRLFYLSVALQETGQFERAEALLNDALAVIETQKLGRTRIIGRIHAYEAVTHSLLGQTGSALHSLRLAVDAGWRQYYDAVNNPCWNNFRGDPRFDAIMAEVKHDIDVQRERVIAEERIRPFQLPELQDKIAVGME